MKKWFSLCSMVSIFSGAMILGAAVQSLNFMQMLGMILLIFGGLFMGLYLTEQD